MVLVALGPLLRAGVDQLGVGLVAGARATARPRGRRSRSCAASRPRRATASPAAAARPAAWPARPRSRRSSSRGTVRRVWPRCRSPWIRWTSRPSSLETASNVARSVAACSASSGTTPSAASSRPVMIAASSAAAAAGRVSEGKWSRKRLVHLAQRLAEPGRLAGEVAAGVLGVQLGVREQRADAGQRQVPAVAGGAQELLQHRELAASGRRRRRRASRRARRRARSRPGSAPRAPRCRGSRPGVTLRNTFISASSPKATEELDCSPLNSVECASRSSS